jgi:hypothetical protein
MLECRFQKPVSVTPGTTIRAGGNVVKEFHDIYSGGERSLAGRIVVERIRCR